MAKRIRKCALPTCSKWAEQKGEAGSQQAGPCRCENRTTPAGNRAHKGPLWRPIGKIDGHRDPGFLIATSRPPVAASSQASSLWSTLLQYSTIKPVIHCYLFTRGEGAFLIDKKIPQSSRQKYPQGYNSGNHVCHFRLKKQK